MISKTTQNSYYDGSVISWPGPAALSSPGAVAKGMYVTRWASNRVPVGCDTGNLQTPFLVPLLAVGGRLRLGAHRINDRDEYAYLRLQKPALCQSGRAL
jgi:hypothetical protein